MRAPQPSIPNLTSPTLSSIKTLHKPKNPARQPQFPKYAKTSFLLVHGTTAQNIPCPLRDLHPSRRPALFPRLCPQEPELTPGQLLLSLRPAALRYSNSVVLEDRVCGRSVLYSQCLVRSLTKRCVERISFCPSFLSGRVTWLLYEVLWDDCTLFLRYLYLEEKLRVPSLPQRNEEVTAS